MSMFNYTSWSINERGLDCHARFETPMGIVAHLYKDWLYIEDVASWTLAGPFAEPVVAEVNAGALCYKDLHVCAHKDDNGTGIFFVACWAMQPDVDVSTAEDWEYIHAMYGIGKYAFTDAGAWIGITGEDIQAYYEWLEEAHQGCCDAPLPYPRTKAQNA